MASALENEIIQPGQALHMGEMDPAIPLSPDFDLRYWLEKIYLIGGWHWSEQRVVF